MIVTPSCARRPFGRSAIDLDVSVSLNPFDLKVRYAWYHSTASARLLMKKALDRCETEVCHTKRPTTAQREKPASANPKAKLGDYSMAAITPDLVAGYHDRRLAEGLSASTLRLELALLSLL